MASKNNSPAAFLSYSHFDDEHEGGRITQLRERLTLEVKFQTGEEFLIFQDRNDINWGQNWKTRIHGALGAVTFLIPILTPSFFKSDYCRGEVEKFLDREKQLDRNDLILPIYYFDTPLLNNADQRSHDALAESIMEHQYADWRELRYEPWGSAPVRRAVARLASQIRDALQRQSEQPEVPAGAAATRGPARATQRPASTKRARKKASRTKSAAPAARRARGSMKASPSSAVVEAQSETASAPSGPSRKTEVPTHVVDALHRGDFSTITAAIEAAQPGDRILVRPGLYREGLVIDKTLEIIGDGKREDVVIEAKGKDVLMFQTTMGRVANLTMRQLGGGDWYAVDITQGRLDLEDCDITCKSLTCVGIHAGADPRLRRNRIHDGKASGVLSTKTARGRWRTTTSSATLCRGLRLETTPIPPCVATASTTARHLVFMSTRTARGRWRTTTSSATSVQALRSLGAVALRFAATASTRTVSQRFGSSKAGEDYSKITIFERTPEERGISPTTPSPT